MQTPPSWCDTSGSGCSGEGENNTPTNIPESGANSSKNSSRQTSSGDNSNNNANANAFMKYMRPVGGPPPPPPMPVPMPGCYMGHQGHQGHGSSPFGVGGIGGGGGGGQYRMPHCSHMYYPPAGGTGGHHPHHPHHHMPTMPMYYPPPGHPHPHPPTGTASTAQRMPPHMMHPPYRHHHPMGMGYVPMGPYPPPPYYPYPPGSRYGSPRSGVPAPHAWNDYNQYAMQRSAPPGHMVTSSPRCMGEAAGEGAKPSDQRKVRAKKTTKKSDVSFGSDSPFSDDEFGVFTEEQSKRRSKYRTLLRELAVNDGPLEVFNGSMKPQTLRQAICMYIDYLSVLNENRVRVEEFNTAPLMEPGFEFEDYYHEALNEEVHFPSGMFKNWLAGYGVSIEVTDDPEGTDPGEKIVVITNLGNPKPPATENSQPNQTNPNTDFQPIDQRSDGLVNSGFAAGDQDPSTTTCVDPASLLLPPGDTTTLAATTGVMGPSTGVMGPSPGLVGDPSPGVMGRSPVLVGDPSPVNTFLAVDKVTGTIDEGCVITLIEDDDDGVGVDGGPLGGATLIVDGGHNNNTRFVNAFAPVIVEAQSGSANANATVAVSNNNKTRATKRKSRYDSSDVYENYLPPRKSCIDRRQKGNSSASNKNTTERQQSKNSTPIQENLEHRQFSFVANIPAAPVQDGTSFLSDAAAFFGENTNINNNNNNDILSGNSTICQQLPVDVDTSSFLCTPQNYNKIPDSVTATLATGSDDIQLLSNSHHITDDGIVSAQPFQQTDDQGDNFTSSYSADFQRGLHTPIFDEFGGITPMGSRYGFPVAAPGTDQASGGQLRMNDPVLIETAGKRRKMSAVVEGSAVGSGIGEFFSDESSQDTTGSVGVGDGDLDGIHALSPGVPALLGMKQLQSQFTGQLQFQSPVVTSTATLDQQQQQHVFQRAIMEKDNHHMALPVSMDFPSPFRGDDTLSWQMREAMENVGIVLEDSMGSGQDTGQA